MTMTAMTTTFDDDDDDADEGNTPSDCGDGGSVLSIGTFFELIVTRAL